MRGSIKYIFIFYCLVSSLTIKAQTIITWAGNGPGGGIDGIGDGLNRDSATFINPANCFFDNQGNFYIAEQGQNRVRKIDTLGIITSIAGTSHSGYNGDSGLADTTELHQPVSVISNSIDDIYITDVANYRIRKIDHITGVITTIAGTGVQGYTGDNGPAINAQIYLPADLCIDSKNNILIADNAKIRKINSSGIITTIAGNGSFSSSVNGGLADTSAIGGVTGICVDSVDNIYVADDHNGLIYKIDNSGIITVIAGTTAGYLYNGDNIPARSAHIIPSKIKVDKKTGNLFFLDIIPNNRIRMIDRAGLVHTVAGNGTLNSTGDYGLADTAGVPDPTGFGFDNCGNLFISQSGIPACIREVIFDTTCHIHHATGIANVNNILADIKIYPNPTTNVLHVNAPATYVQCTYRLMNIVGVTVLSGNVQQGNNTIDIHELATGVYVLEVADGQQRIIKKIIKQ